MHQCFSELLNVFMANNLKQFLFLSCFKLYSESLTVLVCKFRIFKNNSQKSFYYEVKINCIIDYFFVTFFYMFLFCAANSVASYLLQIFLSSEAPENYCK